MSHPRTHNNFAEKKEFCEEIGARRTKLDEEFDVYKNVRRVNLQNHQKKRVRGKEKSQID